VGTGHCIALVLHPRRDPGAVLDVVGKWSAAHGSSLLIRGDDAARWDGATTVVSDAELTELADEAVAFNDLAFVRVPGDGVVEATRWSWRRSRRWRHRPPARHLGR
jgi:hypothetical protein